MVSARLVVRIMTPLAEEDYNIYIQHSFIHPQTLSRNLSNGQKEYGKKVRLTSNQLRFSIKISASSISKSAFHIVASSRISNRRVSTVSVSVPSSPALMV
jgi:hypothetical protein